MTYRPILLSQNAPPWKYENLGYSSYTIGRYGCLLACFAMLAQDSVSRMNSCRKRTGGYVPATAYASNFDIVKCAPGVRLAYQSQIWIQPVPQADMTRLLVHLDARQPAIIEVDWRGDSSGVGHRDNQHFVTAIDHVEGLIHIYDPWDGTARTLTPRYGSTNAKAIWRYMLYEVNQ